MKSSNLWRIIWIIGIYAILATILYLVVLYKVEWEDKDLNTYLYFYDCNRNLCTSTTVQDDYYSKVLCEDDICPYITDVIGNNLILKRDTAAWIYNYLDGQIINDNYVDYRYIDSDFLAVTDNTGKQGVIDLTGNELVKAKYDYIDSYNNGFISYIKNNLYGIDTLDEKYSVDANFEDIVLINDELFAGKKNNVYHIYSYKNIDKEGAATYNFIYANNDVILVVDDKKIDILTTDLNSTLLMKIDTFYEYTTEKERDSLELYSDGENIYFNVFTSEAEYMTYRYNIASKKLI